MEKESVVVDTTARLATTEAATTTKPAQKIPHLGWLDSIGFYDEIEQQHVRLLLVGAQGSGKTLAAAWPNSLFIDTDAGGMTLRKLKIPFIACYETNGIVKKVFDILTAAEKKIGPFAKGGQFADVKRLVFDGISVFSNAALYDYIAQGGKDPMQTKAGFDEYGKLLNTQVALGKAFKRLSQQYDIIVTSLVNVDKDEMTGAMYGGPLIIGQYRQLIGADFDEVYYVTSEGSKENVKHVVYTAKTGIYEAKTRLGLPYKIDLTGPKGEPISLADIITKHMS